MLAPAAALPLAHLHAAFLSILPRIELHAQIYFRHLKCAGRKDDAVAETLAISWKWFVRLVERGKDPLTFPMVLARYAARAVRSGHRVCGQEKGQDVLSRRAQQRHAFVVEVLPAATAAAHEERYTAAGGQRRQDAFEERLRDSTVTPVLDQVAFRLDFPAWLETLTPRERRLIREMADNERALDLSQRFELSPGRISQLRRAFCNDWRKFCSEAAPQRDATRHPSPRA